jgi:biotin carboxylase
LARILLLAATTGYQVRSFAEAARKLGVEVVLATDRCHIMENPWGDNALAVRFEEPEASAVSVTETLSSRGLDIQGIVAVADRPTVIAALIAERLRLPWHPPAAAVVCRDKHRTRALFAAAGLPAPSFVLARTATDMPGFPCVLKPLGLSGSRGVIRANNPAEFRSAFERIERMMGEPQPIQVEQYIPGREFALEGLLTQGRLQTLAIFDKPDPLEGPFFEETIYVTPSLESPRTQQAIIETTARAAGALGLWHGPIHAEMRVNERGVYMLEIGARPIGGLCSRVLRFPPFTLEELVILHAIGQMPATLPDTRPAAGVMMIPVPRAGVFQSVSGVAEARQMPGVEDVIITAKQGEKLVPLPEGASYTGFIFAAGPDPRFVTECLRQAHAALRFEVLSSLDILAT